MGKNATLKKKLMLPIVIYIFIIAAFTVFYTMNTARAMDENSRIYLENTARQMAGVVEKSVSDTAFFAYMLSRNNAVQDLFAAYPNVTYESRSRVESDVSQNGVFLFLNTDVINIVFLDAAYTPFYSTFYSGNDDTVYDYLKDNAALRAAAIHGGVCQINRPIDSIHAPSFIYAVDVFDTRLDKEGNRRIGTIAILCSLEKYRSEFDAVAGPGGGAIRYRVSDPEASLLESEAFDQPGIFPSAIPVNGTPWNFEFRLEAPAYDLNAVLTYGSFPLFAVILAVLAIPLYLLVFHLYLTRPLERLVKNLRGLSPGKRLPPEKYTELAALSGYINITLDQNDSINLELSAKQAEILRLDTIRARSELSALQSQINPHFLYNTLECVRSIARENGVTSIQMIAEAMADIFRYTIKGNEIVRVRDEIAVIRQYLSIINVRFSGRYRSRIEIGEDILDLPILKMVLQPLVENAVFHGLEKKRTGEVVVTGSREGGTGKLTVWDNGGAFSPEVLRRINSLLRENNDEWQAEEGIGVINIHRKIRLYYGEAYGLQIASDPDRGTFVTVCVPLP